MYVLLPMSGVGLIPKNIPQPLSIMGAPVTLGLCTPMLVYGTPYFTPIKVF